jgi:uncharacterized small protein (DUF1192 family)
MLAGMSPFALRDKAKAFLAKAKDDGIVMAQAEELKKRDQEITDLKAQMERLMANVEKRGPGRPKKEAE